MDILILHGWNLSGKHYKPLIEILETKGHRVFAPDLPGFGSNKQTNISYTMQEYADFVDTFIKEKKLDNCILLGHSFGGRVGIVYASEHASVLKLVLTGVPGYSPVPPLKAKILKSCTKIGKRIVNIIPNKSLEHSFQLLWAKATGSYDYYKTDESMKQTFRNVISYDLSAHMKNITIPTVLIWGGADSITPVWIAEKMSAAIRGSSLHVIDEGGHSAIFKNPKEFAEILENTV